MTTDEHQRFIDRQKAMADAAGKAVASSVLAKMDLREVLTNGKRARARFIATILKESDPHFNDTLNLGREFFKVKFGA
jgi:hypothetical protein